MSKNHAHGGAKDEAAPETENPGGGVPNGQDTPGGTAEPPETEAQGPSWAETGAGKNKPAPEDNPAGEGPAEAAEPGEAPCPEEIIADLEARLADAKDQFLRKAADFENFRKRMIREKQDAIDFANQSLLLDLIPIIDDFERAIQSAGSSQDFNSLYEGIGMIEKRLISQLETKWGLKRFDSAGEPFDPNRHEALMMEKSAEITEPVVKEDLLKGYMLKDRVIRSAKVKVCMPETGGPAETADAGG
ncbi:MAG: nucleotide exchange factor GrpE [Treponema sp.]|jgi:molecular chaperone GrpE|nr:nucleotide exchange factor GrpE [Treponema sp.]